VTRRVLLRAAGVAGGGLLTGCVDHPTPGTPGPTRAGDGRVLIFLTTQQGVSVYDGRGQIIAGPYAVSVATPDWAHAVIAEPAGAGTRIVVRDLASGRMSSVTTFPDRLEPRIVSPAGDLVAAVTPGGAGVYGLHEAAGRDRTTVVVADHGGERVRLDLPGNLEPEAFSPDGRQLFLLDYLPAERPQRFRVRVVDLVNRLPVPIAEGQLRAYRIMNVYDPARVMLFTLYSFEADAKAFIHCLGEGWSRRIDLPAPFGQQRPGVHAIALSAPGERLYAVHAPSASLADIDVDRLAVTGVTALAATGLSGKPNLQVTASGRIAVNVEGAVILDRSPPRDRQTGRAAWTGPRRRQRPLGRVPRRRDPVRHRHRQGDPATRGAGSVCGQAPTLIRCHRSWITGASWNCTP